MQITIQRSGEPESSETFTLTYLDTTCPLCSARPPVWIAPPATPAAMDPSTSPIGAGEACAPCVSLLAEQGIIEITNVDPDSF